MTITFRSLFFRTAVFLLIAGAAGLVWTLYRTGQYAALSGNLYAIRKLAQERTPTVPCKDGWVKINESELSRYFPDGRDVIYDCSWDQVISAGKIPDIWGTPIRVYRGVNSNGKCDYVVVSAGCDKQFGTSDDKAVGQ